MYSEFQRVFVHDKDGDIVDCMNCGATVLFDEDSERFVFTCPCGEVDPERVLHILGE